MGETKALCLKLSLLVFIQPNSFVIINCMIILYERTLREFVSVEHISVNLGP